MRKLRDALGSLTRAVQLDPRQSERNPDRQGGVANPQAGRRQRSRDRRSFSSPMIQVLQPGMFTTVQDLGRQ